MSARTSQFLSSGILATWGGVLAWFYFSGRISDYLHPAFQAFAGLAGIVFLLLAAAGLRRRPHGHGGCGCCADHGHSHGPGIFQSVILTVPLVAAALISPDRFGATAVQNRGLVESIGSLPAAAGPVAEGTMMDPERYLKKDPAGRIRAEAVDLLYASAEPTMRGDFENKEIEVVGQFVPARTGNPDGNRFQIVRMFVMCCAADARPVAVTVQAAKPVTFPGMTWLKVTGRATFPLEAGKRTALIVADSIQEVDPPENSFITE